MKHIILLIFILSFSGLYSQTNGIVSGKVLDAKDNNPLESATIKLFPESDTIPNDGTLTNKSGEFTINNLSFGKYKLEVSFIGYKSFLLSFFLDNSKPNYDAGTIKLSSVMDTVANIEVVGEKPIMTFEGDKKVFDVSNTSLFKGGSVLDILRKTPLVDVDANDNVTMRGSQNVIIMIDGKPNKMINLKQLPAEMVQKIEVITNPPAKYEAEGISGIINIVLKKSEEAGYQGNVNMSIGNQDKYNGGFYLNYKKDKFSLFSGAFLGKQSNFFENNSLITYYIPETFFLKSDGNSKNTSRYIAIPLGVEYELFPKHNFGIEGFTSLGDFKGNYNTINAYLNNASAVTSYYKRNYLNDGDFNYTNGSFYYNGKLNDKGDELSGEVNYLYNKTDYLGYIKRTYFDIFGNLFPNSPEQNDNSKNHSQTVTTQIDYTNKISDNFKFETGAKFIYRDNDNDFISDTLNYYTGIFDRNFSTSNHFKLTDNISAAYGIASSTLLGINWKLGLRAENTYTTGEQAIGNQNFTKKYFDLFPSFSLSKSFGQTNQLQLNYSRRITRPNIWRMNPFVNRADPKFVYYGNPDLNPEYTNSFELSYMLFTPIGTITPLTFFRRTTDVISSYSYLGDSNVTYTTYKNASAFNSYGLDLIINSSALKWLNFSATISLYDTKFDADAITDYANEEGFSWKAVIRTTLVISDLFNFEIYYNYAGKKVNAQGISKPNSSLDISISRTFFNDNLTLSIRSSNLLKSVNYGQEVSTPGYSSSSSFYPNAQTVFLSLSYKFGNTNKYIMKQKKTKQNVNEGQDQQQDNTK